MPVLDIGRIVWVELLDRQGKNRKRRPAVVMVSAAEIAAGQPIMVVAVSTKVPSPLPDDHVKLPWSRAGRAKTGLREPCAAICAWIDEIESSDVLECAGIVPGKELRQIGEKLATYLESEDDD